MEVWEGERVSRQPGSKQYMIFLMINPDTKDAQTQFFCQGPYAPNINVRHCEVGLEI